MKKILLFLLLISFSTSLLSQNTLNPEDAFIYFMKANGHKKSDNSKNSLYRNKGTWFDIYARTFMKYQLQQAQNDEFKRQKYTKEINNRIDNKLRNLSFSEVYTYNLNGYFGSYDFNNKAFPISYGLKDFNLVSDAQGLFVGINSIVNKDELNEYIKIDASKAESIVNSRKASNGKVNRKVYLKIFFNVTKRKPNDKGSNGYKNTDLHIYVHKIDVYLDQYQNKLLGAIKPANDWEDKVSGIATLDGQVKLKDGQFTTVVNYKNGKIVNPVKSYYANGQVRTIGTYNYLNAPDDYQIKNGTQVSWYYANGNLEQTAYFNDKNKWNGELVRYYESGKVKEIIGYKNGYKNGCYKKYYEDGRCNMKSYMNTFMYYVNDKFDAYNTSCKCTPPRVDNKNIRKGSNSERQFLGNNNSKTKTLNQSDLSQNSKSVPFALVEVKPKFPGCESSLNDYCTREKILKFINKKFDKSIPQRLGITDRIRITTSFTFNKSGDITDIYVKSPHNDIKEEMIRILKALPKITSGKQNGSDVSVLYSIPIIIKI